MVRLPPDDRPPPPGPASEVDALVAAGPPGPDNPGTVGAGFWAPLPEPEGPDLTILSVVVTPESWPGWGDFRRAAALLPDYGMAHQATPSVDDPDVVYLGIPERPVAPSASPPTRCWSATSSSRRWCAV